ncbi:hypothetical protein GQ457_09G021260 [Hibiscus cannabinus]
MTTLRFHKTLGNIITRAIDFVSNVEHKKQREDDIIEEGEVVRKEIDGVISIDFSERIISLAEKSLEQTIFVKLLGRKIGYTTMRNKIYELWKPSQPFKLLDIENDYFLVSFQVQVDYERILSMGQIMTWIRLPGLLVIMYRKSIITKIEKSIGPVVRIDYQTVTPFTRVRSKKRHVAD